ncbi:MAG: Uma2 family endonuclease [Acetobacteraceae bacterium]|nr:Uma2 family endonuclease [Acetobacteraceae bacterium]
MPESARIEVDEETDREPDAGIHCGGPIPRESLTGPHPVVVEVISPSSNRIDTQFKRDVHFRVSSIQH